MHTKFPLYELRLVEYNYLPPSSPFITIVLCAALHSNCSTTHKGQSRAEQDRMFLLGEEGCASETIPLPKPPTQSTVEVRVVILKANTHTPLHNQGQCSTTNSHHYNTPSFEELTRLTWYSIYFYWCIKVKKV